MTTTRDFDLGDILSITTGRLVSRRHIDGIYDILNFMTHDNLFTHQLPRASDQCKPELLRQHPQLAEIDEVLARTDTDGWTGTHWEHWLDERTAKYGRTLSVAPMSAGSYAHRDPIEELHAMAPKAQIVVAVAGGNDAKG